MTSITSGSGYAPIWIRCCIRLRGWPIPPRAGDADTALHVARTRRLNQGATLTQVMEHFRQQLGVASRILPMTDERVETRIDTDEGDLAFQDYFVRRRCAPRA